MRSRLRLTAKILAMVPLWIGVSAGQTFPLYLNSGGTGYTYGNTWSGDAYFSGGATDSIPSSVFIPNGGLNRNTFASRRFGDSFSYIFTNVPLGTYSIDLYFADWEATAAGQRVFDVSVNGTAALTTYDIYAASASFLGRVEHVTNVPISAGSLTITFSKHEGSLPAQINGIVITQTGSLPATTLNGCQQIARPGSYVLTSDLVVPSGYSSACLYFLNTGVNTSTILNCQGHSISSTNPAFVNILTVDTVPNFSMMNCTFNVITPWNSGVQILRSPQSSLSNNVINNASVFVGDSDNATLTNNTITMGGIFLLPIQQSHLSGLSINGNIINTTDATQINSSIQGDYLTNSTLTNNTVHGSKTYTDDAIVLGDSSGVTIQGNTLTDTFDTGIEFYGSNDQIKVLNNTIDSTARGIGGWYDLSMTNSIIDGNAVTNATVFDFNYAHMRTNPSTYTVAFSGNQISNNSVSDGCVGPCNGPSAYFDFTGDFSTNPVQPLTKTSITNNVLTNNNFDLNAYGPHLNPPSGFVDGGGNICSIFGIYPPNGYPINCRTSSPCATPGSGQFHACYWPNQSWNGLEAVNRMESYPINLNWGGGAPSCSANLSGMGQNCPGNMSATWTGNFSFAGGFYTFTIHGGGGTITASIDGVQMFNRSYPILAGYYTPYAYFLTGGTHTITLTFVSNGYAGYSDAELSWVPQ